MTVMTGRREFLIKSHQSYWIESTPPTEYPSLEEDISTDVAIVGGGMAGITSAYLLSQKGVKVTVLEANRILLGTTAHTTAKLTSQHGLIYDQIKRQHGEQKVKQYAEANEAAIHFVADLIKQEKIECDFSWQSAFVYTQAEDYIKQLETELKIAEQLGIKAHFDTQLPLPIVIKGALRFDDQAQFHPRKYLLALAESCVKKGNQIFENSKVIDIRGEGPYEIFTHQGRTVTAKKIILTSHYPFHLVPGLYFSRIYQERAYAVVAKAKETFPGGMYVNAESPTRSLRSLPTESGGRILIVGEKHKTGQGENLNEHYENLMDFAKELYTVEDFPYRWSTQDGTTLDDIPYIGRMSGEREDIYIATGFRKWGMTNSTVAGMLLSDLIINGESPWEDVYNPLRSMTINSATQFVIQNSDVAIHLISGKLKSGEEYYDLAPEQAVTALIDGRRVGVYKDPENHLHIVDITCTHMGCELNWNDAETSWECPCHGSRFSIDGEVLEGPALKPLEKVTER